MVGAEGPPKYARIVDAIKSGIQDGTYRPGQMLPTEVQLQERFKVSRQTVVRALTMLAQEGWISREQGRGSFAKGVPASSGGQASRGGRAVLDRVEAVEGTMVVAVGQRPAPPWVARLLRLVPGAAVLHREVVAVDEERPTDLATVWVPLDVAAGTELARPDPMTSGWREHIERVKRVKFVRVRERLSARRPTAREAWALALEKDDPVLGLMAVVVDDAGRPLLVVDEAMPGSLHELEDEYDL